MSYKRYREIADQESVLDKEEVDQIIKYNVLPTLAGGTLLFCFTMFVTYALPYDFGWYILSIVAYIGLAIATFGFGSRGMNGAALISFYGLSFASGFMQRPVLAFAIDYLGSFEYATQLFLMAVLAAKGVHNHRRTAKDSKAAYAESLKEFSRDLFVSPADLGVKGRACEWAAHCGISVDGAGMTLCAIGGMIDGLFGLGLRTWEWPRLTRAQLLALCDHCGRGMKLGPDVAGELDRIQLGNLDAKRDWGFSGDYAEAIWRILQHHQADDFVISTGETYTVREFLAETFGLLDLNWQDFVEINDRYKRPAEVPALLGDSSKARTMLGWKPKVSFKQLCEMMLESDLKAKGLSMEQARENAKNVARRMK